MKHLTSSMDEANVICNKRKLAMHVENFKAMYKTMALDEELDYSEVQTNTTAMVIEFEIKQSTPYENELSRKQRCNVVRRICKDMAKMFVMPEEVSIMEIRTEVVPFIPKMPQSLTKEYSDPYDSESDSDSDDDRDSDDGDSDADEHEPEPKTKKTEVYSQTIRYVFSRLSATIPETVYFIEKVLNVSKVSKIWAESAEEGEKCDVSAYSCQAMRAVRMCGNLSRLYEVTFGHRTYVDDLKPPRGNKYKHMSINRTKNAIELNDEYSIACREHWKKFKKTKWTDGDVADVATNTEIEALRVDEQDRVIVDHYVKILDMLEPLKDDEEKWTEIVRALRAVNSCYLPLARKYSFGSEHFDKISSVWDADLSGDLVSRINILQIARQYNRTNFKKICTESCTEMLDYFVKRFGGKIQPGMAALLIEFMLCHQYIRDGDRWFEFVTPGRHHKKGELYKWRELGVDKRCANMYKSAQEMLRHYFTEIYDTYDSRFKEFKEQNVIDDMSKDEKAATKEKIKYMKKVLESIRKSESRLYQTSFVESCLREMEYKFDLFGFSEHLDKDTNTIGVGNGILVLTPEPKLVRGFNKYWVSKYTPVDYTPYDPSLSYIRLIEDHLLPSIFVEKDAQESIMMLFASGLDGKQKESKLFQGEGRGANAKSTIMELVSRCYGDYAKKVDVGILTGKRRGGGEADSNLMQLASPTRFAYCSELEKSETLSASKLKAFLGQEKVSGRQLYKEQQNFDVTCCLGLGTNYAITIESMDHGLWRRIWYYNYKRTFTDTPNPEDPMQMRKDSRFNGGLKNDPDFLKAFMAVLLRYYYKYVNEYNRDMDAIMCDTIKNETRAYRNTMDRVNQFIESRIVEVRMSESKKSPLDSSAELDPDDVVSAYIKWYGSKIDPTRRVQISEIHNQFAGSVINKYKRFKEVVGVSSDYPVYTGLRMLDEDESIFDGDVRPKEFVLL